MLSYLYGRYRYIHPCILSHYFFCQQKFHLLVCDKKCLLTVNQKILAAIKFGVSQNSDLAAIKFGISPSMQCTINVTCVCWLQQILAKTRNSPNSPNIIARQNLLIYSTF